MHLPVKDFGAGWMVLTGQAENPVDLIGPDQPLQGKVVVPIAQAGNPLRVLEPPLGEGVFVPLQPASLEQVANSQQDLRGGERLADEILGAVAQGGQLLLRLGGDGQDGRFPVGFDRLEVRRQAEPVRPRQLPVDQDQVIVILPMELADRGGVLRRRHFAIAVASRRTRSSSAAWAAEPSTIRIRAAVRREVASGTVVEGGLLLREWPGGADPVGSGKGRADSS